MADVQQLAVDLRLTGNFNQGMGQAQKNLKGFTQQAKGATAQAGRFGTFTNKLGGSMRNLATQAKGSILQGVGLGAGVVGFQALSAAVNVAVDYMGNAVGMASDLAESQSKVDQVFTDSAITIRRWAEGAATNFGLTEQAALEAAGTFGNFIQALGNTEDEANAMSRGLVELAADLASFNNQDIGEVLISLRAGLAGEAEPMRRLGVSISAARVEANLLAKGIVTTKDDITDAMKVAERYAIIFEDTSKAQGDFARTSDGLANSSRILSAQLADIQAEIGTALLPIITDATRFIVSDVIPSFKDWGETIGNLITGVGQLGDDLNNLIGRDIGNDIANTMRIATTGGVTLFTDAIGKLQTEGDPANDILEDLAGESTLLGGIWHDLAGEGTLVGDSVTDLGRTLGFVTEQYNVLSGVSVDAYDAIDRSAGAMDDAADASQQLNRVMIRLDASFLDSASSIRRTSRDFAAFREDADAIAESRSLDKINKDLNKQRRLQREAAEAGNVRAFARAQAAIQELKAEAELRREGKRGLQAYLTRTKKEMGAQSLVTSGIADSTKAARELLRQTRKRYNISIKVDNRQLAATLALARQTGAALGSFASNLSANLPFGGQRAEGGPVQAGRAYIVGERRPELFVPRTSGYIQPQVGGMGGVNVYVRPTLMIAASQVEKETTRVVRTHRARANT